MNISKATPPLILVGRIHHVISTNISKQSAARKRGRPWDHHHADADVDDNTHTASSTNTNEHAMKGFVFVCDDIKSNSDNSQHPATSYVAKGSMHPLVVPLTLSRAACHAAVTGKVVHISQYSLIQYRGCWGELVFDSTSGAQLNYVAKGLGGDDTRHSYFVIELHRVGLRLDTDWGHNNDGKQPNILTLDMLAEKESESLSKGSKKTFGKNPMNVTGIVDAISPILFSDELGEPFAIIELYQLSNGSSIHSAVAVMKGENVLCMHPGIHPGDSISLMGVVSRKWKVPDEFRQRCNDEVSNGTNVDFYQKLCERTPDRVILVVEAKSIEWNGTIEKRCVIGSCQTVVPMPSTVESLTSVQGVVKAVNYHCMENEDIKHSDHVVHFVTLQLATVFHDTSTDEDHSDETLTERRLARIYLPKYAIPPTLLFGMQPGATLRAVNIHFIHPPGRSYLCFVACLRSTISVECCAGEKEQTADDRAIRFVSLGKPFSLVPDHRITAICNNRFGSKSSAQRYTEEKLRSKLKSKHYGTDGKITSSAAESAEAKSLCLLNYHFNTATNRDMRPYKSYSQSNKPSDMKRKSNHVQIGKNGRLTMRDPYAEFFDHGHINSIASNKECGTSCENCFTSYNQHVNHMLSVTLPVVVEVSYIRSACVLSFVDKVATLVRRKSPPKDVDSHRDIRVSSGWTSSFHFHGTDLYDSLHDHVMFKQKNKSSAGRKLYTGGNVELVTNGSEHGFPTGFLHGDNSTTPIHQTSQSLGGRSETRLFGWIEVDSVIVSCLCLGQGIQKSDENGATEQHTADFVPYTFLPSTHSDDKDASGHTFIFLIDNLIFIASVLITASSIVRISKSEERSDKRLQGVTSEKASVQECLHHTTSRELAHNSPAVIVGRLVRQRFKFRKVKRTTQSSVKCYEGWTVILSHIGNSPDDFLSYPSILQTLEAHIAVPFNDSSEVQSNIQEGTLRSVVNSLFSKGHGRSDRMSQDQTTLGMAWWHASEHNTMLPLLSGGWDSCNNQLFTGEHDSELKLATSVNVEIPFTSRTISKLGYQRFNCHLPDIKSYFVLEKSRVENNAGRRGFHGSTGKLLPGMINRQLCRVGADKVQSLTTRKNPYSLLCRLKDEGVTNTTLEELHWEVCFALREGNHAYLRPSLLRRIHNANVLGISFCRARVECTQCFEFLTPSSDDKNNPTLRCPSGCASSHSAVKWECSVLVDDGTGQAKLYAERQAALLLLSDGLDVSTVERGAWSCGNGIFYQPALPPSSHLRKCIEDATLSIRNHTLSNKRKKKEVNNTSPSVFSLLPAYAKAEYLIQQHCRHWYQRNHHRKIDLFCRCKPLSEDVTTVNQTEVQVAKAIAQVGLDFGTAPTATLPPLKLVLEDACLASEDSQGDNMTGWKLLNILIDS